MKSIYQKLLLVLCATLLFSACTEENTTTEPTTECSAAFSLGKPSLSSVNLLIESQNAVRYAYQLTSDMDATAPESAILFAEYTTGDIDSSRATIKLENLDGDTHYKLFIAAEYADQAGYSDTEELTFTTATFTEFVTILPTENKFGARFHIEVPAGEIVSYAVIDQETYTGLTEYGYTDPDFLQQAEEKLNLLSESTTIDFDGWYAPNETTGEMELSAVPQPGQALRLIVSAMQKGDIDHENRQEYEAKFDYDAYLEAFSKYQNVTIDNFWLTEYHEVVNFNVEPPVLVDAPAGCKITKLTTRSAEFEITLNDQIDAVRYLHVDNATWNTVESQLGYDGAICWATKYAGEALSDFGYRATDLEFGMTYRLILIGHANEDGTMHSINIVEFTPIEATKPAPEIQVSAIKAPEGYQEKATEVWFNIKSPSKDVVYFKYLCNDVREWIHTLNSGNSYTTMMQGANIVDAADAVDAVNSDEGFNIMFNSWEDTTSRLVVAAANDEEFLSDPEDKSARADNTTIPMPDAERVESSLFEDLQGEWLLSSKLMMSEYNPHEDVYIYKPSSTITTTKVTICEAPSDHTPTCPKEAYALYPTKTPEEVDALYEEFLASAEKYKNKVRGQNRLVCLGLGLDNVYTTYMSPFGLFIDPMYSAAVTTDDLFMDYGPKWYLQINQGDKVTLPVDQSIIPSLANHDFFQLFQSGIDIENPTYNNEAKEFDVTISEDKNTITVHPKVVNDITYYYAIGTNNAGAYMPLIICSTFELTRIESNSAPALSPAPKMNYPTIPSDIKTTRRYPRTRLVAPSHVIEEHYSAKSTSWQELLKGSASKYIAQE